MQLELQGKVAFVAGSSRGIGLSIARAFVAEGTKVVITGRDNRSLEVAQRSLVRDGDRANVLAISGDMTDPEAVRAALARTEATFGGYDIVVANVGSGVSRGGWDLSPADWNAALNTNLLGAMVLATAAMPLLVARRSGSLIVISSIAGMEAISAPIPYSASKAALQSAMKSLSRLVGPDGVRVNAVAPGNVLFPGGRWEQKLAEQPGVFEQYVRDEVPLQRFGRPEDVADAVLFLASERANFVTGACLVVDGGQTRAF